MQENTPLSGIINHLRDLRTQDRRNAAETYAAAAHLTTISERAIATTSDLIDEFAQEDQKALPADILSARLQEIEALKKSQRSLQQYNDTYRVQRELTLQLLKERNVDPHIIAEVEALNNRQALSLHKRIELFQQMVGWQRSPIIHLVRKYVRYTKLDD